MYPLSIIIFLILCYGFGYLATFFLKNSEHFFERHLMRLGVGLGAWIAVGYFLNLLRIPLDYKIFLFIIFISGLAIFANRYWKHKTLFLAKPTFNINIYVIGMLILFFITFFMYHKGAFSYPYLENDDPWGHAVGTKYVSLEKTLFAPQGSSIRYMDPYPPAYDFIMGIMHQTNTSVMWTLKFFNALIISLCIIFFYFFANQLTGSSKKAFFSTFALFAMPAFMSHFIWALAITMPLFFVGFYCLECIKEDRRWLFPSMIVGMAALTSSPSHSVYFGLCLGVYLAVKTFVHRRFLWPEYLAALGAALLSFLLWWLPEIIRKGLIAVSQGISGQQGFTVSVSGTADRQYVLADFLYAQKTNLINNPIGIGTVLCALIVFVLIFLLFRYRETIGKNKLLIPAIFIILFTIMTLALSSQYIKFVPKKGIEWREPGSTPFMEFVHDQMLLIGLLAIFLFLLILMMVESWRNAEFKEYSVVLALAWMMIAWYAVNASPFAVRLSPFRAWMILAIPLALLVGEALSVCYSLVKSLAKSFSNQTISQMISMGLMILLFYGIYQTSFVQKYAVNTSQWYPGGFWTSAEEIGGYLWMQQNLPFNTPITSFSNTPLIVAFGHYSCVWCAEDRDFTRTKFNSTFEQTHSFLKEKSYRYIIFDGQTAQRHGVNATSAKINELISHGYAPAYQTSGFILLKVP